MNIHDYINKYQNKFFFLKCYNRKQLVFNEADYCSKIGFLLSGQINISSSTFSEKEEIITIVTPGNWFGEFLAFTDHPYYLGNGIVVKNAEIAFISLNDLKQLCLNDSDFFSLYMKMLCEKTLEIKNQAKLFCHKNIRDRIMYYLTNIYKKTNAKVISISSIETFSGTLALPRPSVSRELIKMQNDGLIKKNHNSITILF